MAPAATDRGVGRYEELRRLQIGPSAAARMPTRLATGDEDGLDLSAAAAPPPAVRRPPRSAALLGGALLPEAGIVRMALSGSASAPVCSGRAARSGTSALPRPATSSTG
ncbi:unnamed protein product [Urochloa humidicola]